MESSLSAVNAAALAGVMVLGALVPGVSVLTVSARSAALGFRHGALASAGIVAGDMVYILVAIYGLSTLADLFGEQVVLVRYIGAACLVWLGLALWRSGPATRRADASNMSSVSSSFLAGLLVTLADQKAVLFYLGILPAFMDMSRLSVIDTVIILLIAVLAVGTPKLIYVLLAERGAQLFNSPRSARAVNVTTASVLIGVAILLLLQA